MDFFKLLYRPSLQSFNIHIPFLHHPNNVYNSKTACLENGKWRTALFSFTLIHFTPFLLTSRFCGSSSLNVASRRTVISLSSKTGLSLTASGYWILFVLLAAVIEVEISQNCWPVLLTWSQAYPRGPPFQELKKS